MAGSEIEHNSKCNEAPGFEGLHPGNPAVSRTAG